MLSYRLCNWPWTDNQYRVSLPLVARWLKNLLTIPVTPDSVSFVDCIIIHNIICPALSENYGFLSYLCQSWSWNLLWPIKCEQNQFPIKSWEAQRGNQKAGGGTGSLPSSFCFKSHLWQWPPLSMTAIPSEQPIPHGYSSHCVPLTLFPLPDSSSLKWYQHPITARPCILQHGHLTSAILLL